MFVKLNFLRAAVAGAALTVTVGRTVAAEPNPAAKPTSVVVILADDLGYSDLAITGAKDIPTPNIDALARGGVRFTAAYSSCPICAPSRVGLLTGRYQQRSGFDDNNGSAEADNYGIDPSETTLAESFKSAGYATAAFGKWHIGSRAGYQPNDRGFDEFFGFLGGGLKADKEQKATKEGKPSKVEKAARRAAAIANGEEVANLSKRAKIQRQREVVGESRYLTEAFASEGVDFINRQAAANKPFFLYLPFNAVHQPVESTEKYLSRFPNLPEGRHTYAAMVSALDDAVGQVTETLRARHLEENTLVIFMSDNGGPTGGGATGNFSTNEPFRGRKATFFEGGIRVPLFVSWKGKIAPGTVVDQPVILLDVLPTALAAAGKPHVGTKALDGRDLLPLATGKSKAAIHDVLFWRYHDNFAARDRQWKLIRAAGQPEQLYDLLTDVAEQNNVAGEHPEIAKRLSAAIDDWNKTLEKPRWVRTVKRADGEGSEAAPAPIGQEFR